MPKNNIKPPLIKEEHQIAKSIKGRHMNIEKNFIFDFKELLPNFPSKIESSKASDVALV